MATTFIEFVPSNVPPAPNFQVTLDGNIYTVTVLWNLFAQRYYIQVQALNGEVVLYTALVGSPIGIRILALSWSGGKVTITTTVNHNLPIGSMVMVTVTGAIPSAYNGLVQAFVTDRNELTYSLASDPGASTTLGSIQQNINLVAGLFVDTLVYRAANAQFEVTTS